MMATSTRLFCLALIVNWATFPCQSGELTFRLTSETDQLLPCRIHLADAEENGKAHHPPEVPFWRGGFVCDGVAALQLPAGIYRYEIEKGPEWEIIKATIEVTDDPVEVDATLKRVADLKSEGWFSGDLHVHRAPQEMPLHLQAEDLSIASVQTWWNESNPWASLVPPVQVKWISKRSSHRRFYDILSGEDERGGGALLYHRMKQAIDITFAEREWPASVHFLEEAKKAGAWVEIEKPFWWDTPLWLATGQVDSIGIAHNHMNRSEVLGNEAWGRPRDLNRYPGVYGNGLYTQDLYYKILNSGLRLPPTAGSASGVLPNPVGYNRVYVHTGQNAGGFAWDSWWEGLRAGRCFVTNGPLLRIRANGTLSGETLHGSSNAPLTVEIDGDIDSRDPIRKIELVHNGKITEIKLPANIIVRQSGWFLIRAIADVSDTFRFASTAPWFVEIDDEPLKPDYAAASFFLEWAKQRKGNVERAIADEVKRSEVSAAHAKAISFWQDTVAHATQPLNVLTDLDYAGNDHSRQKLDLILPGSRAVHRDDEDAPPLPLIVWIHGGAWKGGDKKSGHGWLSAYVKTGQFAGASIGYRLSGEAIWPAQIHDCKAAIRWLRGHAEEYSLDPDRIAVWGSSAGGHLAAMLGVSNGIEQLEGTVGLHLDRRSDVQCVIDFFGPTDFLRMNDFPGAMDHDAANSPESLLVGGAIQDHKAAVAAANPITYVDAADVPMLLVHGTHDRLVPLNQSELLHAALQAVKVNSALIKVANAGHGFKSAAVDRRVSAFLDKHLLGVEDDGTPGDETVTDR